MKEKLQRHSFLQLSSCAENGTPQFETCFTTCKVSGKSNEIVFLTLFGGLNRRMALCANTLSSRLTGKTRDLTAHHHLLTFHHVTGKIVSKKKEKEIILPPRL